MGEFAPLQSLGGGVIPYRTTPAMTHRVLAPVESAAKGQGPEARMDTKSPKAQAARRAGADADTPPPESFKPKIDDFTLLGPSPAFQANVLEIERDLRRTIERLEAERSRVEAEAAIAVDRADSRADADTARARSRAEAELAQAKATEPAAPAPDTAADATAPEPDTTEQA